VHGQKAFNGVALLSKLPFDEVAPGLIGDGGDVQARFLEVLVSTKTGALRVVSLYLPNGNPAPGDKYAYKLKWLDRLIAFSHERMKLEEPMVLAGDFNVIPTPADAKRPDAWTKDALFLPETREKFRALTNLGLTDAIRATSDDGGLYTFWDYQAGAFQKDDGIRIDHLLLSPQAADRLIDADVDRYVRSWDKPSDHVPVYVDLDIEGANAYSRRVSIQRRR
jgi:exodeoxyribonuclease III